MSKKLYTIQNSFTAGEISSHMIARSDLTFYKSAAKTLTNAYNQATGGVVRRPGTVFIDEIFDSTQSAKLIPYIYSRSLAYVLVFNSGRIEFLRDEQYILSGSSRYYIAMPFTEAELPQVKYTQVGNTLFIAHPNHAPQKLQRLSDTNWTLSPIDFTYDAVSDTTYQNAWIRFKIVSGTTKWIIGDIINIDSNGGWGVPSGNTGNGTVVGIQNTPGNPGDNYVITCYYVDNQRQKWHVVGSVSGKLVAMFSTGNYPAAVSAFEQRLYWAGTKNSPNVVWGSVVGMYEDLTVGMTDEMGVMFRIDSTTFETIMHLQTTKQLLPLSYGGEFSITGGQQSITSTHYKITSQTYHGTSDVKPVRVGDEILFVQRGGKKLRAITYDLQTDINSAPDITVLAADITKAGIKDMTFSAEPDFIVWLTTYTGELLSCTHLRDYKTTGWAKHKTVGKFENLTSIPNSTIDQTYLIVNRTINGATKRYIEYLDYVDGAEQDAALFGLSTTPQLVWSGLSHLEGEIVAIIADGAPHVNRTVVNGSITLQQPAKAITVGVPYDTTVELLHPNISLPDGTSQGRVVGMSEIVIMVQNTMGLSVNDQPYTFRDFTNTLDTPLPKYSGDLTINMSGWLSPNTIKITQTLPQPLEILGVVSKLIVNE